MPQQKKPAYLYSVYLSMYASQEVKELVKRGESHITQPTQVKIQAFYFGSSERQTAAKFYQAAKAAMHNPLAISITVDRDFDTLIRVLVN